MFDEAFFGADDIGGGGFFNPDRVLNPVRVGKEPFQGCQLPKQLPDILFRQTFDETFFGEDDVGDDRFFNPDRVLNPVRIWKSHLHISNHSSIFSTSSF